MTTSDDIECLAGEIPAHAGPRYPVDLRLTLPVPGRPVFLAVLAGRERRSAPRRRAERRHHPLATAGNALFVLLGLTGAYSLALFAALVLGSVLEF